MEAIPTTQGHSTPIDGWGLKSNKHLYDFIQDQQASWDEREKLFRESNRVFRNTIVEQKRAIRDIETTTDFYDRMNVNRSQISALYGEMKIDTYRDEGYKFQWIERF